MRLALILALLAPLAYGQQEMIGNTERFGNTEFGILPYYDSSVMGLEYFNQNFAESTGVIDALQFVSSNFQQQTPLTYRAADACSVTYGTKQYIFAGYGANATTYQNYVQIFDSTANTWALGTSMPTAEWGAGCALIGTDVWLFGGATAATGQTGTTLVQVYHLLTDTWDTTKTQLPVALPDGVMATTVGGYIYIQWESTFLRLDPTGSGTYTTLPTPPAPCSVQWGANGYIQIGGDDRIYVAGGSTASTSGYTNATCYYSIANGWSSGLATAPYSAHGQLRNAVYGGQLYYIAGYDGTYFYDQLFAFNPSTNTWSSVLGATNSFADGVAGGFIGNTLYVMGGRNAGNLLSPFGIAANEAFAIGSTPVTQTFTKIWLNYNEGSPSGSVDLGIYADGGSSGPGSLIVDAGSVEIANGWVSISGLSQNLTPGTRYWLAFTQSTAKHVSYTGGSPKNPNATNAHCFANLTYGALPSTFPSSGFSCINTSMYAEKLTVN